MIKLVNANNATSNAFLLDQMFRQRKNTFQERLRWKLNAGAEYEVDKYDMLQPLYVLALDETQNNVLGSLRLLPTTGPNLLSDVFCDLLPNSIPIRGATFWEVSRYCVDTSDREGWNYKGVHKVTAELILALCEIGLELGLEGILAVIDMRMESILRRLNCKGKRMGTPRIYGDQKVVAVMWDTSFNREQILRTSFGINYPVLQNRNLIKL